MKKNNATQKIALLLPTLMGGGAERVLVNLANYFAGQGFVVDLLVAQKKGHYLKDISATVNLISLGKKRVLWTLLPLMNYFKTQKPAAILVTIPHISAIAILANVLTGKPLPLFVRQPNYLSLNNKQSFWQNCYFKVLVYLFNQAKGVIAISQGVNLDLKKQGVKRVQTIYNPALFPKLESLGKETVQALGSEKPLFIAVGRLVKQKNHTLLLNAFAKVKSQIGGQLFILGEGELKENLTKQIEHLGLKQSVKLLGFVANPYPMIKNADVLVLSSLWEGFGNVIVEALALGTQVVATDCQSGPAEILASGQYGFLAQNNHCDDLSRQMINAWQNPIDKKALKSRAQDFAIATIAEQYKAILLGE